MAKGKFESNALRPRDNINPQWDPYTLLDMEDGHLDGKINDQLLRPTAITLNSKSDVHSNMHICVTSRTQILVVSFALGCLLCLVVLAAVTAIRKFKKAQTKPSYDRAVYLYNYEEQETELEYKDV